MTDYDHGPIQTYEITWTSGHIEQIQAHQVSYSGDATDLTPLGLPHRKSPRRVHFHGHLDSHWRLVLSAREEDIAAIRLVTGGETFLGTVLGDDQADGGR